MSNNFSYLSEAGTDKSSLIKGLQLIQAKEGYVPDDGIRAVAKHFGVADAEGYNYPSFMGMELIPGYLKDAKGGRFFE